MHLRLQKLLSQVKVPESKIAYINIFWILIFTIKYEIALSIKSEEGHSVNFEEKI